MRADELIGVPDPTLHAEFGSTALPGINEIHRIAVSAPGRPTAERQTLRRIPAIGRLRWTIMKRSPVYGLVNSIPMR
jgi:hypothetical protein